MFNFLGLKTDMHILFLTDNFPPEGNAPATRTFEHAREWVDKGHTVTVITCAPNFPEGKVFEGYKNKWLSKKKIEGINVWRVKTYITANEGFIKRTIDFISFMFSSLFFGLFTRKVDVVIGTSPQFFTVISAWVLAKFKRVPFVFELRDIWPASITAVGAMKGSWIIKFLEKLELFLYGQADLIISVTRSFKQELQNRGVSANKIKVVFNGVDLSKYKPLPEKDKEFAEQFQLQGKFVAGYVGTHGLAHALDSIIEAAELLKDEDDIRIMFAGGGADRARLEKLVEAHDLSNVVMIPRQPKENMQKIWSLCDVSLVSLKDTPLFSTVIPSKMFESMAMKLPIIISVPEGESTEIVRKEKLGLVIAPENPYRLAEALLNIKKDNDMYNTYAKNCFLAAIKFNRKKLSIKMLNYIEVI
jgi:colanic acid biosynthesis glycosyl transferase WcaI